MRAGAESSRTTASVGSLGEQTLFAQRSPYGHPKSEIGSQVCFDRGDLSLWTGAPQGDARRLGETANGPAGCGLGDRDSGACARGGSLPLIAGPSARRNRGARADIAGCHCAIANRAVAGDRDDASVSDHRRCQRRRQHCVIGGDAHGFALRLRAGVRLSTVRSSTRPPLGRPRLSQSLP